MTFNDSVTENNEAFMGSAVSGIISGQRSFVLLWNPVDSGVDLWVDRIVAANSKATASAADLRPVDQPYGTVHLNGFNKALGRPRSKAEIRAGHMPSLPLVTGRMHEYWLSAPSTDEAYPMNPPVKVPPGHGLFVSQWVASEHTIASFQWREAVSTEPAPPPPPPGPFGNMTVNGGLAAAFDSNTAQPFIAAACTATPASSGWAGKPHGAVVNSVKVYPTTDEGFDGNSGVLDFELYGAQTQPAHDTDGVLLGSLSGQGDKTTGFYEVFSADTVTAFPFVWVRVTSPTAGNHTFCISEIEVL